MSEGVDRGGLIYRIEVEDAWRQGLADFKAAIAGIKKDLGDVAASARSVAQPTGGRAPRRTNDADVSALKQMEAAEKRITAILGDQAKVAGLLEELELRRVALSDLNAKQLKQIDPANTNEQVTAAKKELDLREAQQASILANAEANNRAITTAEETERDKRTSSLQADLEKRQALAEEDAARQESIIRSNAKIQASFDKDRLKGIENLEFASRQADKALADVQPAPVENQGLLDRIRGFLELKSAEDKTESSSSTLLFTFRRLFGVLALFTLVRTIVRDFISLITATVTLNSELEKARLGIASLILSSGAVRDVTGKVAQNSQGFSIALNEASKQMQKLRVDALQTNTSFENLVETFQQGISPGLKAGLNLDQIREFTVRIAQAGSTLGLQQNQLAEEIRSILSGNIQSRTTRIATALGITPEDIRLAKQAGQLAEFLQVKFAGFAQAGKAASETFAVLFQNIVNGINLAVQAGGLDFFTQLKGLLKDILGLTTTKSEGLFGEILKPNPAITSFIIAISAGLIAAVQQARLLIANLTSTNLIQLGITIGNGIALAAHGLEALIEGGIKGISTLSQILSGLLSLIKAIFGPSVPQQALVILIQMVVVVTGLKLAFGSLGLSINLLLGAIKIVGSIFIPTLLTILRYLLVSGAAAKDFAAGLNGIKIAGNGMLLPFLALVATLAAAVALGQELRKIGVIQKGADTVAEAIGSVVDGDKNRQKIHDLFVEAQKLKDALEDAQKAGADTGKGQKGIDDLTSRYRVALDAATKFRDAVIKQEEEDRKFRESNKGQIEPQEKSVGQIISNAVASIPSILPDLSKTLGMPGAIEQAKTLTQAFLDTAGAIGSGRERLSQNAAFAKQMRDELEQATSDLQTSTKNVGVSATVAEINRVLAASVLSVKEEARILDTDIIAAKQRVLNVDLQSEQIKQRTRLLDNEDAKALKNTIADGEILRNSFTELATTRRQLAELEIKSKLASDSNKGSILQQVIQTKALLDQQQKSFDAESAHFDNSLKTVKNGEQIKQLAIDTLQVQADQKTVVEDLNNVEADRNTLLQKRVAILDEVLQKQIAEQDLQASRQGKLNQIDLTKERSLTNLGPQGRPIDIEAINQTAELQKQQALLQNMDVDALATQLQQEKILETMRAQGSSIETRLKQQQLFTDENKATARAIDTQVEKVKQLQTVIRQIATEKAEGIQALPDQLKLSAKILEKELPSQFDTVLETMRTLIGGFSSFISDSIVSAFDPSNKQSIKERLASFLRDFARQIIQTLTQIALVKAIALGASAFNTGGEAIKQPSASSGFSNGGSPFLRARGYSFGGPPFARPRGLHPSDIIPAWLAKREWVIKASSAIKYGNKAMSAINEGLVNPMALNGLVNVARGSDVAAATAGPGLAEGGLISDRIANASTAGNNSSTASPSVHIIPGIVATEDTMELLLKGGKNAVLDFMRRHKTELDSGQG